MIRFLLLSIGLLFCSSIWAQKPGIPYSGIVLDKQGAPLTYVSVALQKADGKIFAATVTGQDGVFSFSKVPVADYMLEISCLGYKPVSAKISVESGKYDLGMFRLEDEIAVIDEVVVSARRSLITNEVDRLVYDVENDPEAQKLKTSQILGNMPFVRLNKQDGTFKVFDRDDYVITLNGKKSLFLSEANQYVANLLEGGNLKKIELITTPQGKYADMVAVINIVTKEELPDGIMGIVDLMGATPGIYKGLVDLTSKFDRLTFNAGYDFRGENQLKLTDSSYSINYLSEEKRTNISLQDREARTGTQSGFISGSYDFSEYDLLTFSVRGNTEYSKKWVDGRTAYYDDTDQLSDRYNYNSFSRQNAYKLLGVLNYQKTFKEKPDRIFTTTYRFEDHHTRNYYDLQTEYTQDIRDTENDISRNKTGIQEHTAALDFFDRIHSKHAYFVTAKYVNRHYTSDVNTSPQSEYLRDLNYIQQIGSVRTSYSFRTKKIMFSGDLNLEYTDNDVDFSEDNANLQKRYLYLMPKLNFLYRLSSRSTFSFLYDVPSYRPDIRLLNPYIDDSDPTHLFMGNPNLQPERSHILTSTYRYSRPKLSFFVRARYTYSDNAIYEYDYTTEAGELVSTYGNIGKTNSYAMSTEITYKPTEKIELWGAFQAKRTHYVLDEKDKFWLWHYTGNFTVEWDFWKDFYIMGLGWIDPISTSVQSTKRNYYVGSSLRLGYYVADKIHASVDCQNFYAKRLSNDYEKQTANFYSFKREQRTGRMITLSFTYYFGKLDKQVKKGSREVDNSDRSKEL